MPNIEITTTQNVTVQHRLASVAERFLAGFLDFLVMVVLAIIIGWITDSFDSEDASLLVFLILAVPLVWFYTLTSEAIMNGQTLGKKLVRIKVARLDGRPLTFVDHFTRWSSRLVDIYGSGTSLGMIMMISSEKRQRLGGIISGTVVVKTTFSQKFSLNKIKNLEQYKGVDIVYPEVSRLSERQMLLLKRLLEREKRYSRYDYTVLLRKVANKIKTDLNIESKDKPTVFIKQLLKDYILSSR